MRANSARIVDSTGAAQYTKTRVLGVKGVRGILVDEREIQAHESVQYQWNLHFRQWGRETLALDEYNKYAL